MPTDNSPTVRQRRLAAELRKLREHADITPEAAAAALGWSRPKLVKIETSKRLPTTADVDRILNLYGGDEAKKLTLAQLARDIHKRGWWTAYDDILSGSFAELEDDASSIRIWQVELVPGLLQTEDYASALIRSLGLPDDVADRRLQARMIRKALLARKEAPNVSVVLSETVLRRPVGGSAVMRGQLQALTTATNRPNISVRVLPISVGIYPGLGGGSFTVFGFPRAIDLDVVYLETVAGGMYVEEIEQVKRCSLQFDRIAASALSDEESTAFIAALAQEQS